MPDDFARTQAQIAALWPLDAPVSAAQLKVAPEYPGAEIGRQNGAQGHDRPLMIPRDVPEPSPDNLANLED